MKPIIKDTVMAVFAATTIIGFAYYTNALTAYNDLVDKYSKLADDYDELFNNTRK